MAKKKKKDQEKKHDRTFEFGDSPEDLDELEADMDLSDELSSDDLGDLADILDDADTGETGQTIALGDDEELIDQLLQDDESIGRGTIAMDDSFSEEDDKGGTKVQDSTPGPEQSDTTNTIDSGSLGSEQVADIWKAHVDSNADPMVSVELPSTEPRSVSDEFKLNPRYVKSGIGKIEGAVQVDYRLGRLIDKGGMGEVYSAKQVAVDRRVAFKKIRTSLLKDVEPEKRKRTERKFLSEAHITAELDHPNIVTIHDLGVDQNKNVFYCMEFVSGSEWHKVFDDQTVEQNLDILMSVADGVAYAHSKDVIHRDLKPENVMIGKYHQVLIMDWGLAVELKKGKPTNLGGTPAYLAPEMAKGPKASINKTSDIYLLGALLFHIATGHPPHRGSTVRECIQSAAKNKIREYTLKREALRPLVNIALKAMETEQEDRFQSIAEFQAAVRNFQSTELAINQSFKLTERSQNDLETGRKNKDYEKFSSALFGFREAASLYPENQTAVAAVQETKLAHAECALQKNDFELGLSLLDESVPEEKPLIEKLRKSQRKANSRKNLVRILSIAGVIGLAIFGIVVSVFLANQKQLVADAKASEKQAKTALTAEQKALKAEQEERERAETAEENAKKSLESEKEALAANQKLLVKEKAARERAETAEGNAKKSLESEKEALAANQKLLVKEKAARERAETAEKNAKKSLESEQEALAANRKLLGKEKEARERAEKAEKQANISLENEKKAVAAEKSERKRAVKAELEAKTQRSIAVNRLFYSNINLADSLIRDNQITQAKSILTTTRETFESRDKNPDDKFLKWEFNRLFHLCHPEVTSQAFQKSVGFSPVADNLMVVAFPKGKIQVWDSIKKSTVNLMETQTQVTAFDVSKQSQLIALGSDQSNSKLLLYRLKTRKKIADLGEDIVGNGVKRVEFSPSGTRLLVSDSDGRLYCWKKNGDRFEKSTAFSRLHSRPISDFAFSQDGKSFASISPDGLCLIWNWTNQWPVSAYQHSEALYAIAFRPTNGNRKSVLACAGASGEIVLLNATEKNNFQEWKTISDPKRLSKRKTQILIESFAAHESAINCLAFNDDGSKLFSAGKDRVIRVWDVDNYKKPQKTLRGHGEAIKNLRLVSSGKQVASISSTGNLRLVDIEEYEDQRVYSRPGIDSSQFVRFSQSGNQFVVGDIHGKLTVWNRESKQYQELAFSDNLGKGAKYLRKSGRLITSSANQFSIWKDGKSLFVSEAIGREGKFAVSSDEKWMVTGGDGGLRNGENAQSTSLWNLETGKKIGDLLPKGDRYRVTAIAISPDNTLIAVATGSIEGIVFLFDAKTLKKLDEVEAHRGWISDLVFSSENRLISADSLEGYANVWSTDTGKLVRDKKLNEILGNNIMLSFSPDRRYFATSSNEFEKKTPNSSRKSSYVTTLKVWDAYQLKLVSKKVLKSIVRFIEFRENGQVAFVFNDGRYGIWKINDSQEPELRRFKYASKSSRIINGWNQVSNDMEVTFGQGFTFLTEKNTQMLASYGNVSPCVDAHFVNNDKSVVALYANGQVRMWNLDDQTIAYPIVSKTASKLIALDSHPDGTSFVVCNRNTARVLKVSTGEQQHEWSLDSAIASVNWIDADKIVLGCETGELITISVRDGTQTKESVSRGEKRQITQIEYSADQKTRALLVKRSATDQSGEMLIQSFVDKTWKVIPTGSENEVTRIGMFKSGKRIVSGNKSGTITIWGIPTARSREDLRPILSMANDVNSVNGIAISGDNQVVTTSSNGKSVLWLSAGWEKQ